jgi:hypothetical protein
MPTRFEVPIITWDQGNDFLEVVFSCGHYWFTSISVNNVLKACIGNDGLKGFRISPVNQLIEDLNIFVGDQPVIPVVLLLWAFRGEFTENKTLNELAKLTKGLVVEKI